MKEKKKVVFVVEAMLGGIRQHVCDILIGIDPNKYEKYLIYSENRADEAFFALKSELKRNGIHMVLCNEMQRELGKADLQAYRKLVKYFKRIKPDIVHCHSSKAGIVGRLAARRCKVKKIVYTPNAYSFQEPEQVFWKKGIYIAAEWILGRFMTSITINVSQGERKLALKYHLMPEKRLILIYNAIQEEEEINREKVRADWGINEKKVLVGVTARCAKQKDPFTFLQIAGGICAKRNDVEFIYIGDGPLRDEMVRWVEQRKLTEKIHLPGFLNEASKLVGALDIYLSTALYEGLPYSMIEAMRAGVPLIATDVVGNNELVVEGKNGMLFSAGSIAEGISRLTEQIDGKSIVRADVKETFQRKFSLKHMLSELEKVFDL